MGEPRAVPPPVHPPLTHGEQLAVLDERDRAIIGRMDALQAAVDRLDRRLWLVVLLAGLGGGVAGGTAGQAAELARAVMAESAP